MDQELLAWVDAEVKSITRRYGTPNTYEKDDLLSEGWIVAKKALQDYREEQHASLKTFVRKCVKNKIIDIFRAESYRSHDEFVDDLPVFSQNFYSYIDVCMTLKNIFKEDYEKLEDVINQMEFKQRRKKQGLSCFLHIQRTLKSIEMTQAV